MNAAKKQFGEQDAQVVSKELRVRNEGIWAVIKSTSRLRHYFVARNPHTTTAISLCASVVTTVDNLIEYDDVQKCLVCGLYVGAGKEEDETLNHALDQIVKQAEDNQNQK